MPGRKHHKVIAHYTDGRLAKGTTDDFFPTRSHFHLSDGNGSCMPVHLDELKALFFVKDFNGDAGYHEKKGFLAKNVHGKKIMVEFDDGEIMFGYTLSYSARGHGFFMFPGDPECNNNKIFIIHRATKRVKVRSLPTGYRQQHFPR